MGERRISYISRRVSSESLAFPISAEVLGVLFKFDMLLAEETRLKSCPRCGGMRFAFANEGKPELPGGDCACRDSRRHAALLR
ncbi:MAG: hypothetical protein OXC26_14435 [Albidovulum sp.]|nr:hypothetical protein [Albidovulum sp.]